MYVADREKLDVDVRFLLANERTLLAWVRTSLAIEAGGVALLEIHKHHDYIGLTVLLLGAAMALVGYHRFWVTNRSIRRGHLPPTGIGPAIQVVAIVVTALALAIAQLTVLR